MPQHQDSTALQPLDDTALEAVSGGTGAGVAPSLNGQLPEGVLEVLLNQLGQGPGSAPEQQLQQFQDRNNLLQDFNTVLGVLRGGEPGAQGFGQFTDHAGQQQDVAGWLQQHNIALDGDGNGSLSQGEVTQTVQAIKDTIDGLQSLSQMDMLKLQQQMNNFNQMSALLNQTMQSYQQTIQSIIQKMG